MTMPVLLRIAGLPVDRLDDFHEPMLAHAAIDVLAGPTEKRVGPLDPVGPRKERGIGAEVSMIKNIDHTGAGERTSLWSTFDRTEQYGDGFHGIDAKQRFYAAYSVAHLREQHVLQRSYYDDILSFGATFASQSLSTQLRKFKAGQSIEPRKMRRMELAWLGYLTRACCKPSPFSTFANVGVGFLVGSKTKYGLVPKPWKSHSLIRIKRYIIEQCLLQLSNEEEFLLTLVAHVNNTLRNTDAHSCEFLAPGNWVVHSSQVYTFSVESYVKMKLPIEVCELLLHYLDSGPKICCEMIVDFQGRLGMSRSEALDFLSQLRQIGLVQVHGPWASNSPTLERELLKHLEAQTCRKYSPVREELSKLCALEDGCARNLGAASECSVEIAETLHSLWTSTHAVIPGRARAQYTPIKSVVKHDSFLGCEHTPLGEVGYVPMESVVDALNSLEPLQKVGNVFWAGFDFQHTVSALIAKRVGMHGKVPLESLLKETRTLWKEYTAYELEARTKPLLKPPFNPLHVRAIDDLCSLRARSFEVLQVSRIRNERGDCELLKNSILRQAEGMPTAYRPILPNGLFIQPADRNLETWVLNSTADGTGRIGSRYVHMMPKVTRQHYIQHSVRCGEWSEGSREIALLDVHSIFGEVLNVHPLLSRYVLEMPGERFEAARARRLRLGDLYVSLDKDWPLPRVVSPCKEWLLPVHLGGAGLDFVASSTVRQICNLGASRQPPFIPESDPSEVNGLQRFPRVVTGNVILRRECWLVARSRLPKATTSGPDPDFYLSINRWREESGIPAKAFVRLDVNFDQLNGRHKPQYVDFSSPLFLRLLGSMIQNHDGYVRFEEVLPSAELFANEGSGGHVFEVFVDPLFLRHGCRSPLESSGRTPLPQVAFNNRRSPC